MAGLRGKYRLGRRIGGGGMAEVFEATAIGAEGFARPVAIKRMLPSLSTDPDFGSMFVNEARIASLLHHPNVVSVLDFDRDAAGRYFLVMELVRGVDLRRLVGTGALAPHVGAFVMVEVLAGLAYAHELEQDGTHLGIVHRDVSPHNVMIAWDGAVKVVDFGIAKAVASTGASRSGSLKGKVAYMSPEQVHGKELDGRSDVFAVGVMTYELLTGTRLFSGATEPEILARVLNQPIPPPRQLRPELPPALEAVILRMLERDRKQRFLTAHDAMEALLGTGCVSARGRLDLQDLLRRRFPDEAPVRRAEGQPDILLQRTDAPPEDTPTAPRRPPLPLAAPPRSDSAPAVSPRTLTAPDESGPNVGVGPGPVDRPGAGAGFAHDAGAGSAHDPVAGSAHDPGAGSAQDPAAGAPAAPLAISPAGPVAAWPAVSPRTLTAPDEASGLPAPSTRATPSGLPASTTPATPSGSPAPSMPATPSGSPAPSMPATPSGSPASSMPATPSGSPASTTPATPPARRAAGDTPTHRTRPPQLSRRGTLAIAAAVMAAFAAVVLALVMSGSGGSARHDGEGATEGEGPAEAGGAGAGARIQDQASAGAGATLRSHDGAPTAAAADGQRAENPAAPATATEGQRDPAEPPPSGAAAADDAAGDGHATRASAGGADPSTASAGGADPSHGRTTTPSGRGGSGPRPGGASGERSGAPAADPQAGGSVIIRVRPWAHVYRDGELVGTTPVDVQLPAGPTHSLVLINPELERRETVRVKVEAGERKTLERRWDE